MDGFGDVAGSAVTLVARLCLGLFFLQSATGKIANLQRFIRGTIDYRVLPERGARVFGALLPWWELGLAFALILGIAPPLTSAVTAVLLMCFSIAVTINLRRGRTLPCNCYGIADPSTIGWGTIGRNLLLLVLAATVALGPRAGGMPWWSPPWHTDRLLLASSGAGLLPLLLACCCVCILLLEWTIDISARVSRPGTN